MSSIIHLDFRTKTKIKETTISSSPLPTPTKTEIEIMNALTEAAPSKEELLSLSVWNGACYREIFKEAAMVSDRINADPWDCFAVILNKIEGKKFVRSLDGANMVMHMEGLR